MKKLIILNIILAFLLTGCGKEVQTPVKDYGDVVLSITTPTKNDNCIGQVLMFYKNGKYQFYNTYVAEIQRHLETPFYRYTKSNKGRYGHFNFNKIFEDLELYQDTDDGVKYILYYLPNNATYIIREGEENKYLSELLDSIGVDLDTCAKEDSN